ncbi:hypothetical protein HDU86_001454 [Geranomyces michiganensis]|nr:hypothetical protein HDU86_001454 [Geranomyces michiganensis]
MLAGAGPSGFYNAPVTKAMVISLGINTVLTSLLNVRQKFHLQLWPHVFQNQQLYRLVTTHFYFTSAFQLLFGTCLIYHFRLLERQWSSSKYASFVFMATAISTALTVLGSFLGRAAGLKAVLKGGVPAGPYGLIFAALYEYARGVPHGASQIKIAGKEVNHFLVYALSAQFIFAQFPQSLLSSLCGVLAGVAYDVNFLSIRSYRIPRVVREFASRLFSPFASDEPPARLAGTTVEDQRRELRDRYAATMRGFPPDPAAGRVPAAAVEPPSPDAVAQLEGMGFDRVRVLQALRRTGNNVQVAASFLIDNRQ